MGNVDQGMTKEHYYDMCKALGSTPLEDEIPIEMEDFPELVQIAFSIYGMLDDNWEYMAGTYTGKSKDTIFNIFNLFNVPTEEHLITYRIILTIDRERKAILKSKNT